MGFQGLAPSAWLLLAGLLLDVLLGDPQVRWHPIRLLGDTLSFFERALRRATWDGRGGGCLLLVLLSLVWVALPSILIHAVTRWHWTVGMGLHILVVYVCFASRDLLDHVRRVQAAARAGDLESTRRALGMFVGRDLEQMDLDACRRAAIESLAESFVDGILSPLFWYVLLGVPGLLFFKVVSTMDSMVGYKTPRYLQFGWCGARTDDAMNYVPAPFGWILLMVAGIAFRGTSSRKAWRVALAQHQIVPGPNAGWSETAMAGLLQRRLVGPIWKNGKLINEVWLGDSGDVPGGSDLDVTRAVSVTVLASVIATAIAVGLLLRPS
jgi:adenosylcobinamide-phosphate synthase